jgi:uncharacterized protein (DUF2141 family)
VVVAFSGAGDDLAAHLRASGWAALADAEGFAVAPVAAAGPAEIRAAVAAAERALRVDDGRRFLAAGDAAANPAVAGAAAENFVAACFVTEPNLRNLPIPPGRIGRQSVGTGVVIPAPATPRAVRDAWLAWAARLGYDGPPAGDTRASLLTGAESALVAAGGADASTVARAAWRFLSAHGRGPATVTLTVTNLRSDSGRVAATLFAGPRGFPDDTGRAAAQATTSIDDGRATLVFADVPAPAAYAAVVLHDENANGKMDLSLGLPAEGYGATNNPKARFGPPRYEDARFTVGGRGVNRALSVRVVYLGAG